MQTSVSVSDTSFYHFKDVCTRFKFCLYSLLCYCLRLVVSFNFIFLLLFTFGCKQNFSFCNVVYCFIIVTLLIFLCSFFWFVSIYFSIFFCLKRCDKQNSFFIFLFLLFSVLVFSINSFVLFTNNKVLICFIQSKQTKMCHKDKQNQLIMKSKLSNFFLSLPHTNTFFYFFTTKLVFSTVRNTS